MIENFDIIEGETLLLNKPYRWTSFDVVGKIRKILYYAYNAKIKVGHAGTLDPLATGLMIVCIGRKTKTIEKLQAHYKEYIATITFGSTTPSYDLETEFDNNFPYNHITEDAVKEKLKR